jgi:cyclopropane-fatty-acyl-phospholipid synthase
MLNPHLDPNLSAGSSSQLASNPPTELSHELKRAAELMQRQFTGFKGSLALRFWNGITLKLGNAMYSREPPRFTLVFRNPRVVRTLLFGSKPLRFADAYFQEDMDIEGDFFTAVSLKDYLHSIRISFADKVASLFSLLKLAPASLIVEAQPVIEADAVKEHSREENRQAIAFHYDVSNEFYALWLDKAMVYSCAYFETPEMSLEKAQQAKLDHICRKLLLKPQQTLLDIGCGWGALLIHAAMNYGVRAHGITLSQQQLELATQRIAAAGLQDRVTVELLDYRDLQGEAVYDKVVSVGMFEHIGLENLPLYFDTVKRVLKPSGLFLNHGITHDVEGWKKTLSTEFINRYVFPDGQLDTVSNIQRVMERARFEILDVEALRPHYALTLRHWVHRLEQKHEQALKYVNESTYRVWRLYMAACALEFETGEIGVYQILSSKRDNRQSPTPLTRRHLYT